MLKRTICRFRHDVSGATAIEYALIGAFIAGVISASVAVLGGNLLDKYELVVGLFP